MTDNDSRGVLRAMSRPFCFSLPQLLAQTTGRHFSWVMLARTPDLTILLALRIAIGSTNGLACIAILLRSA
ncbi:MAG: hypothetical protein H7X75_10960 [Burkholderiaceae bacterium]|nr:hypothetical protein [Burkholderiaceae bacterium]